MDSCFGIIGGIQILRDQDFFLCRPFSKRCYCFPGLPYFVAALAVFLFTLKEPPLAWWCHKNNKCFTFFFCFAFCRLARRRARLRSHRGVC